MSKLDELARELTECSCPHNGYNEGYCLACTRAALLAYGEAVREYIASGEEEVGDLGNANAIRSLNLEEI